MKTVVDDLAGISARRPNLKRISSVLGPFLSLVILGAALWFLHRELAGLSRRAILEQIQTIPVFALLAALASTVCSYTILTGYDAAALWYLKKDIPWRRSALTAFMAYAVGHNVGVAALSGGAIRYRMYTLAGLSATEIARIIIFVTATFAVGASALLGLVLLLMPTAQTAMLNVPSSLSSAAGFALLAIPLAYLASSFLRRTPLQFGYWQFALPRPAIALTQMGISIADLIFASATLYVLLASNLNMGFFTFLGIYLLAMAAGLLSSVPGGIGVFEAVLVASLPQMEAATLLGTVIVYRLLYYVLPLSLALMLLANNESRLHGDTLQRSTEKARDWLSGIAPQVIGTAVFLAGAVLLVSGSSPGVEARLQLISRGIPLPILELSHLAGSVVGISLLVLARGLYRRLHGAYLAALIALSLGIGMSLLKGLDYEEALLLGVIFIVLWISRDEFYRQGSVAAQRFPPHWIGAIATVLGIATWIGFVSNRHVEYSNDLWWQFAFNADAPRMLRAGVVAAVSVMGFAMWKVFSNVPITPLPGDAGYDVDSIQRVLEGSNSTVSNLALLGDKRFLWSADRRAFIMYQISGESWIAMGDPVGLADQHEELAWAFRELVDRHNGRVVFYQVSDKSLALYVDLGLTMAKLGEDARVALSEFSLQGSQRAELRQAVNRAIRDGATFEIIPRALVPSIATDLRRVSDSWLLEKTASEKSFSIGAFSESYVANFDCAVVRVNNEIVAFANLWQAPAGGELSVDLMRYGHNAPKGIMDYLFAELMLWGAAHDYAWFSLGMAPLSGLEHRSLAPLWHKLGHLVFTQGDGFYNFEGLRNFKAKFDPEWQPRYLACPGGWFNLPLALFDISRLISGGVTKIISK